MNEFKKKIKNKLLMRGFPNEKLINNRGLIGATIDEVILEVVKNIGVTRCCGALKKEETAFDLWLKNFKKTTYGYWYDENTIYCREAMQDIYKNEVKPTL